MEVASVYEYKFVRIEVGGFPLGTLKPKEDYHRLIEGYAKEGGDSFRFSRRRSQLVAAASQNILSLSSKKR